MRNTQLGSLGREQGAEPLTLASLPPEVDYQSQNCDLEHSAGHCQADHNFLTEAICGGGAAGGTGGGGGVGGVRGGFLSV